MMLRPALLAALLAAAMPVQALSLVEVWHAATAHDPGLAAARAAGAAAAPRREQASALWRPVVALEGGAGWVGNESVIRGAQFSAPGMGTMGGAAFNTSVTSGSSTRVMLAARQPLWSAERSAQSAQLDIAADAAELGWQDAQQAAMLQGVWHYFNLALAAERLRVLGRQQQAVEQALAEARDRFTAGDRPVIDVHEARARAEGLRAQKQVAEVELELARVALQDFSGIAADDAALALPAELPDVQAVGKLDDWLARAQRSNPAVLLAEANARNAAQEVAKTRAAFAPTLDLVAQAGRDNLDGSGAYGDAGTTMNTRAIGLQLTLPIYTGGMRSARQAEALALQEQARAGHDQARTLVMQQVKGAWLGLQAGAVQVAALDAAVQASEARLDATRIGREAGDRTMLDQLNAENDAAAAHLALAQARVQLLTDRLKLEMLAGQLDEAALVKADAMLANR